MHKCLNCGKEYEGNFCPFCGAHMGEEKLCPKCGSHCSPNAKFCNNCGYAFDGAEKSVSKNTGSISKSTIKIHLFAEYLPCSLFLIFSVLLFGLFAAPVAIMPGGEVLGEKIPSQSYGNLSTFAAANITSFSQTFKFTASLVSFLPRYRRFLRFVLRFFHARALLNSNV